MPMEKTAWITDSTCGLPQEYLEKHNIYVLPLSVIVNDVSYRDDIDITKEQFYEELQTHGNGAKTSQPAYGEFITLYEKLKETYDRGIAIHASSELTGTYQSSRMAAKDTGFDVEVIDSKIGAYALGKMIQKGIEMEASGESYEAIVAEIRSYPERAEMFLLPASFDQMRKSGRVSTTQALFASLLNMHVILGFDDGKVVVESKVRTKKRARNRFFEIIESGIQTHQLKEMCVMHAGVKEKALQWKDELESLHSQLKVKIETLVPVAGVHTGYGTMAVSWLPDTK